ncbi:MAG TPA: hypothetical protein VKT81_00935 [Bryobacteraceae bacterium]|nr:hypothetical protein [Bryobacteraceae bacterium]
MQRLKRLVLFAALAGAVLTVVGIGTESRAIAQAVRAALVQNVDEPGRHPYIETVTCETGNCVLTFPAVPSGQRLVVTSVSAESFAISGRVLELRGHGTVIQYLPITSFFNNVGSSNLHNLSYFDAGESPSILCFDCNPNPTNLSATLSGYFISLP